jgi:hypothetical protein
MVLLLLHYRAAVCAWLRLAAAAQCVALHHFVKDGINTFVRGTGTF